MDRILALHLFCSFIAHLDEFYSMWYIELLDFEKFEMGFEIRYISDE